jgi:hypothetical protein
MFLMERKILGFFSVGVYRICSDIVLILTLPGKMLYRLVTSASDFPILTYVCDGLRRNLEKLQKLAESSRGHLVSSLTISRL